MAAPRRIGALLSLLLLLPRAAAADEGSGARDGVGSGDAVAPSAPPVETTRLKSPPRLTDEQLREQGWQFDAELGQAGTTAARLTALSAGTLVHGAGHFVMGEEATGWKLLLGEVASITVGLGGLALVEANPSTSWLHATGEAMAVAGTAGFGLTWLGDLLGTLRGTGAPLPENTSRSEGLSAELWYATTVIQGEGTAVLAAAVPLRLRHFVASAEFHAAPTAAYQLLGLYAAGRLPIGQLGLTESELGVAVTDERLTEAGAGRLALEPRLSLEADFGSIAPHFANIVLRAHGGVEVSQLRFDPADRFGISDEADIWRMPVGGEVSANLARSVNVGLGYEQRDSRPLGRNSYGGYFTGRVGIPLQRKVGLELKAERGAGVRLWLGLRWLPGTLLPTPTPAE